MLHINANLLRCVALSHIPWALAAPTDNSAPSKDNLPIVDLGYSKYKPTNYNATGKYYNFTNIRYAAPPLGNLRFSPPQPPVDQSSKGVQDGNDGNVCPQAAPSTWDWRNENIPNGQVIPIGNSTLPESEDCLFLDVVVPEKVFKRAGKTTAGKAAPVMVNIHGGGFFIGDKATLYPPQGLLAASENEMIFVTMNYRLTAFGFLGQLDNGPSNATNVNAGLLDQRQALKWVQKNIHLFGGDPSQVTIYGESGGGASLMFHVIAYGGSKENNLFHRAIGQSPGPQVGEAAKVKKASEAFLAELGVKSADEARKLPTEKLIAANAKVESSLPYFGPIVDGNLVPDLPSRLYVKNKHVQGLQVLAAHNSDEARLFIPPTSDDQTAFDNFLSFQFGDASKEQLAYINNTLYPFPPGPSNPYKTQNERLSLLDADVYNLCWTVLLSSIFVANGAYNFIFGIDPGYHAQDLAYTFYNGQAFQVDVDVAVAKAMQKGVANFVLWGNPNGGGNGRRNEVTRRQEPDEASLVQNGGGNFPQWKADLQTVIKGGEQAVKKAPVLKFQNEGNVQGTEDAAGRCGWFFETGFANSN